MAQKEGYTRGYAKALRREAAMLRRNDHPIYASVAASLDRDAAAIERAALSKAEGK